MTLHPCCPDEALVVTGTYTARGVHVAASWDCPVCGTSGGTLWHLAPEWMREKAVQEFMERAKLIKAT